MLRIFAAFAAVSALVACSSSETATPAADAGPRCDYPVKVYPNGWNPAESKCPAACPVGVVTGRVPAVELCTTSCSADAECPNPVRCDTIAGSCRYPCKAIDDCPKGMVECESGGFCR